MTGQSTVRYGVVCIVVYDVGRTDDRAVLESQQKSNGDKLK